MKRILDIAKTAALASALSLAAVAAVPGLAMAAAGFEAAEPTTTITCRGDGNNCPIEFDGTPVELKLESVVVEQ